MKGRVSMIVMIGGSAIKNYKYIYIHGRVVINKPFHYKNNLHPNNVNKRKDN